MSVPWGVIGAQIAYRKSWFEEVGYGKFPETWEQYHDAGRKLKAKGRPIGQTLGHTFGDSPTFSSRSIGLLDSSGRAFVFSWFMPPKLTLVRTVGKKARAFARAIELTESNRQRNQANALQVFECSEMKLDAL